MGEGKERKCLPVCLSVCVCLSSPECPGRGLLRGDIFGWSMVKEDAHVQRRSVLPVRKKQRERYL